MCSEMVRVSIPAKFTAMNGESLTKTVVITNPQGFHLRPVTKFAQVAASFQSNVTVKRGNDAVNGKSPLEMTLMLSLPGTELTIEVAGPDARAALDALVAVMLTPVEEE